MENDKDMAQKEIDKLYNKLNRETEAGGYHLNPDKEFTKELVQGLLVNEKRYGYQACPCRLATSIKEQDLDIICPCDYRDADLNEFDTCYCGLYVSQTVVDGKKEIDKIPERRPGKEERIKMATNIERVAISALPLPIWRCKVCGYLCAREEPPAVCPICKAKKERFEKFISAKGNR